MAWQLPGTLVLPAGELGLAICTISDSTGAQIDEIFCRNASCLWHATELELEGACVDEHRLSVGERVTNVAMRSAVLAGTCFDEHQILVERGHAMNSRNVTMNTAILVGTCFDEHWLSVVASSCNVEMRSTVHAGACFDEHHDQL